jgi:hypothetical protein
VRWAEQLAPGLVPHLAVLLFAYTEMLGKRFFNRDRKHRMPVLVPFACSNYDFVSGKINILYSQATTFH